jgi:hypothetical protein
LVLSGFGFFNFELCDLFGACDFEFGAFLKNKILFMQTKTKNWVGKKAPAFKLLDQD